jgi:prepilin-type N-terminal cleavage/methylation domain-containing protein
MKERGFTLIESLAALGIALFVIVSSLEFFRLAHKAFHRVKEKAEAGQSALAALDKMRIDLLHAGRGLASETALGLVEPARASEGELRTTCLEKRLELSGEALAGDTRILLETTAGIAAGQEICFSDGTAGEVRAVARVDRGAVILAQPLEGGYAPGMTAVSLLETVAYFLDRPAGVLRRRVNSGSAQPLLEKAAAAAWLYDPAARLVRVRLEISANGAKAHEATVFLKNPALAAPR